MQTEILDRLVLELSQITQATSAKEQALQRRIDSLKLAIQPFANIVLTSSGRIPVERLLLDDWLSLVRAYKAEY